ncbi:MAG: hypothetical protein R2849_18320 [Thermomicrobiales bacterium]
MAVGSGAGASVSVGSGSSVAAGSSVGLGFGSSVDVAVSASGDGVGETPVAVSLGAPVDDGVSSGAVVVSSRVVVGMPDTSSDVPEGEGITVGSSSSEPRPRKMKIDPSTRMTITTPTMVTDRIAEDP